jgi:hypothetical protein
VIWIFAKGRLCNKFQDSSFKVDKSVKVTSFCASTHEILRHVWNRVHSLAVLRPYITYLQLFWGTVRLYYLICSRDINKRFGNLKECLPHPSYAVFFQVISLFTVYLCGF